MGEKIVENLSRMDLKIPDDLLREMDNLRSNRDEIRSRIDSYAPIRSALKIWLADADGFVACSESFVRTNQNRRILFLWEMTAFQSQTNEMIEQAQKLNKEAHMLSKLETDVHYIANLQVRDTAGMENSLNELWQHVGERTVAKIGICGLGGSGKTFLLRSFYNKAANLNIFNPQLFITVSQTFDIRSVQKQILECLHLPQKQDESIEIQATTIFRALIGKRYLLALDDVWEPLYAGKVGFPDPLENGCKIVFTTRSQHVGVTMKAERMISIEPLGMENAWELFCRHAGNTVFSEPKITEIGKEIVKTCNGLPLALVTIGRAVAKLRTELEWKRALDSLKQSDKTTNVSKSLDETVLATVSTSYKMLDSQLLKDCFLYCSLFPKNYSIRKEELISYWIGEGFINEFLEGRHKAQMFYNVGRHLIQQLNEASLVQKGNNHPKSEVIMHDLVRQFALKQMGNRFLVEAGRQLTTSPPSTKWLEVERVSLMNCNVESLDAVPYCPKLLTLILRNSIYLRKVPHNIFQSHSLRVLDLSNTGIREIPHSIGSLVQLGYLDLSFTKITSLPKEVRQLVKLKHLGLEGTRFLTAIPGNMVSKLSNVMVLNMFDSYGDWEVKECQGEESRASMEELEWLAWRELQDIGITISSTPAFSWFLSSHPLTRLTQKLILKNCQDLSTFHLSSFLKNVRKLTVSDCRILKEFIIGSTGEEELETQKLSLEVLQLMGLYRTQILFSKWVVPGNCLWMLREITMDSCYELRDVTWVSQLKSLEHLNLYCCKKIESLIEDGTNEGGPESLDAFQKLKTMTLRKLPGLKRICKGTLKFLCLESLKVLECPQLKILPLGTSSAEESMRVISGEKEWWKDLEWEDERAIFKFHEYFQAE